MADTYAFCWNSRRWLFFMDAAGRYPTTCPYEAKCDNCTYSEERKPTKYLLERLRILCEPEKEGAR